MCGSWGHTTVGVAILTLQNWSIPAMLLWDSSLWARERDRKIVLIQGVARAGNHARHANAASC